MNETMKAQAEKLSIGDVSRICGVPSHTIRYWEKEFGDYLCPNRTAGKQRRYAERDIQRLVRIKKLLWIDGFTIAGAHRTLRGDAVFPLLAADKDIDEILNPLSNAA
ncbi:MAG: MerR family transcriptional regulator [Chitinivibrionales bacterium]|nr:MerR family transcriptional regulator [Chitinivibrionales bacterium]